MARYFSSFPDWNAGRTVVKYRYHRAKGAAAMRYTLMHKEIPVLDMDLDEATSSVQKIAAVYQPRHLPLGTGTKKDGVDRAALNAWWIDRSIPASRSGVRRALETLDLPNTQMLLTRCFGLSLSDQYWVRPEDSGLTWKQINFFEDPFSENVGDVLLGKAADAAGFDLRSPDNTSDGYLKKRWKIIGGKRCLLKAGSNPFMQQPFNEAAASLVAQRLGIPHVPYTLLWDEGVPYSVCEDFITPDTELVSARRVMQTVKKDNSTSVYQHYLNCCRALGVADIALAVDQMIVLDYLIANEDRHQNNFGLIRDANTLEWLGAAPIFDSGSSLGYDKLPPQILSPRMTECKPFKRTHDEQIKLVRSFAWIDFDQLDGIEQDLRRIFNQAGDYMDENRKSAILAAFSARSDNLKALAKTQHPIDDQTQDVEQDVAEDYVD